MIVLSRWRAEQTEGRRIPGREKGNEGRAKVLVRRRQGLAGDLFPWRLRPSVVRRLARGKFAEDGERHTIIGAGVCSQFEHFAEIRTFV